MLRPLADRRMVFAARVTSRVCALLAGALGLAAVLGWILDYVPLRCPLPGAVPMNPVSAIGIVLSAVSLWIMCNIEAGPGWRVRQVAQLLAIVVILLGTQRLLSELLSWRWPVDELLFPDRLNGNRMAPNTAACFILIGAALGCLDVERGRRHLRPSVWLALAPGCVAMVSITGYLYNVKPLYGIKGYVSMAINTAGAFVLLTIGTFCARPEKDPVATLVSRTGGGANARRLLPVAVAAPMFLGWLRLSGERAHYFSAELGTAMFAVGLMGIFVSMTYISGRSLARAEMRRRATEDALAASEAFYHSLVETLPQNIFRKDLQGRFTFGNGNFLKVMRRRLEDITGKSDFDFFPRELAERYRKDDQAVIRTGKAVESIEEHVTPTGATIYVQVIKTAVYDDTGRVIGTQGIFWDVTDKKNAERMLEEKNRQLEEAAQAEREANEALRQAQGQLVQSEKLAGLGQMVAGVAHEINNPLAFVSNNVAVMQRDVAAIGELIGLYKQGGGGGNGEVNEEIAGKIAALEERIDLAYTLGNLEGLFSRSRDGLRRIQQIVKDLRDFARLDQSDLQEADVNAGIESTINIVQGHARRKQIKLTTELGPLPKVTCYPAKINQVIMNLVTNAIDASPDGSEVVVRTEAVEGGVQIEVRDHGHGIPQGIRDKIFDPFFTTKPIGQGTGLGLSISYGIIRDHGGEIGVESEAGKGTVFRLKLPLAAPRREGKKGLRWEALTPAGDGGAA